MNLARRGTNSAIYAMVLGAGFVGFSLVGVFGYPHIASRYYFGLWSGCIFFGVGLVALVVLVIVRRHMNSKAKAARVTDRWSQLDGV